MKKAILHITAIFLLYGYLLVGICSPATLLGSLLFAASTPSLERGDDASHSGKSRVCALRRHLATEKRYNLLFDALALRATVSDNVGFAAHRVAPIEKRPTVGASYRSRPRDPPLS